MSEAFAGLNELHEWGIGHGDAHVDNMMIGENMHLYWIDYSQSCVLVRVWQMSIVVSFLDWHLLNYKLKLKI